MTGNPVSPDRFGLWNGTGQPVMVFIVFGVRIRMSISEPALQNLVALNFAAFRRDLEDQTTDLEYGVETVKKGYLVKSDGRSPIPSSDSYEVLYFLEKLTTIDVQTLRTDLFFVHAAVLEHEDKACLLSAPSGSGKSTTAWAFAHLGFGYLSDELAPIDLNAFVIHPYPHAVCMKTEPPAPFALPEGTCRTSRTLHVPVFDIPRVIEKPVELSMLVFVQFDKSLAGPELRALTPGEASARLYSNGLNQLAHPNQGLAAAAAVASRTKNFALRTTQDLARSASMIAEVMDGA